MMKADIKNLSAGVFFFFFVVVRGGLRRLKLAHRISPIENPIQIRDLRKTIARLETELTLKQQ